MSLMVLLMVFYVIVCNSVIVHPDDKREMIASDRDHISDQPPAAGHDIL